MLTPRVFPYFIQERLGFDSNIFEQSFSELEIQKKVFETYSLLLKVGFEWYKSGQTEHKDFQSFIGNNLLFSQDEINVLFNEACPEAEEFFEIHEMEEQSEQEVWPNENYFSEYLEYRKQPMTSFNGFSTSANN
jgi:hypothetical protein